MTSASSRQRQGGEPSSGIECPKCAWLNQAGSLFCERCIAPLNIAKLSELSAGERFTSAAALLQVLTPIVSAERVALEVSQARLLGAYLNAFWLRPETALIQAVEASLLRGYLADRPAGPFADLGCGDGVHTALMMDWVFGEDFDVFQDLALNADDVFDSPPSETGRAPLVERGQEIDLGIDIKASMVSRAALLGAFRQTMQADGSDLPLASDSYAAIYSNVLRDFPDHVLEKVLGECSRVLRPGGLLLFSTPTESYRDWLHFYRQAKQDDSEGRREAAARSLRLDRGRSVFCTQQIGLVDWSARLEAQGFVVESSQVYADRDLMGFWDTGLRPFMPTILEWLGRLEEPAPRRQLKAAAVDLCFQLLAPLFERNLRASDGAFRIIVARKA